MVSKLHNPYILSKNIVKAKQLGASIVALESTVITHGLPRPENLKLAQEMESAVRDNGAVPATIAFINGKIHVGLSDETLENLANSENTRKISLRDFGIALAGDLSGGTTVASTLFVASQVGIRTFATGGIGGVHRGAPFDISADLPQLSKSPVLVVCSGAKSILDLPATREVLETQGIPVIGYQTDEFPAFYTTTSGLKVDQRVETPEEAGQIAIESWKASIKSAVLLVVPPPIEFALDEDEMESAIQMALEEAEKLNIHGNAVTPFLLSRVSELTAGASLQANLALLINNAKIAALTSVAMNEIEGIGVY